MFYKGEIDYNEWQELIKEALDSLFVPQNELEATNYMQNIEGKKAIAIRHVENEVEEMECD